MRTDDGSIIHECLNGEPGAFGVLVDKYKEGIYAFVYDKLRDFRDAQDVTQEVFLQAYRGLRSLRRWESFAFWLYRIAYTRCKMWIRTQSRRVDRDFIADQEPKVLEDFSMDSYRGNRLSESVQEALDSLPETYREVLILYYFSGLNSVDIARALGTSPAAIRHRLSRARARLKEEMVTMMGTAFESQRLPSGFTFRIVEAVKRIRIQPMPRMAGLPWGLSVVVGVIITVMSLNPHLSITSDIAIPTGSPLPVESKVLKTGEIPVDILKTSEISAMSSKQGNDDGGAAQNAFMLAPQQDEGGTWTQKAEMPTARTMLATCVVDGKIYAVGGCKHSGTVFSTLEVYDPKTDTWARKSGMPTARNIEKAAAVVNGKIYVIGGSAGGGRMLSAVEEYDPEMDNWTKKTDMPTARCHASACAVNGKIYVIGGCNQGPNYPGLSIVEEYDPMTDTWARKADMPTPRCSLDTVALNGRIYAIGGIADWKNGPRVSTVDVYDPATDTWTRKADMLVEISGLSAAVVDGKIYAIGGHGKGHIKHPPEVYDPTTDTWTELPDMQIPRVWLSSSALNGKIYAIGGSLQGGGNDNDLSAVVEEFTPEGWQPKAVSPQGKLPTKWGEVKK